MKTTRHKPYTMANSKLSTGSAMLVRYCMFFALLLMGVSASFAQTTRTSVATGDWSTGSTWSGGVVPASSDNVVIAAGHTVTTTGITRTGAVTVNGTLSSSGSFTAGSLAGTGTVTVTGSTKRTLAFGSLNTNTTFSGTITGNANFRKTGTGTLTWNGSGTNTYSGNTSVWSGGKITLGAANRIPDGSYVDLCGTSTLDLNGFNETIAGLSSTSGTCGSGNGHVVTNSSSTLATLTINLPDEGYGSYSGAITGKLNLVVSGGGNYAQQELDGANTYTGTTTVSGGILNILATAALPSATNITITSPGQVALNANATCNTLTLGATLQAAGTYGSTASSATTKNNTFFEAPLTGVLTATSGSSPCLLKTSTKTGNWNDASVWTPYGVPASCDSVVILASHTVTTPTIFAGGAINRTGPVTVNGTLSIPNTSFTAGSLSGSGTITVTGAGNTSTTRRTLTFGSLNTSTTFSGVITGNANFRKTGTGTLTLNGSGANTYTGFTHIAFGGTLRLGSANRIPDGSDLQLCGNSSFDMNGFNETIAALKSDYFSTTVGSTTSICDGNGHSVTNSSATRTTLTIGLANGGYGSFAGAITGNLNLVVSGGGSSAAQELSGANTYTGSTSVSGTNAIPGGTFLTISGANALPSTTQVTITSPAQMTLLANAACSTLTLGATPQTAGTYGSTASSATTKNDTFFDVSGTGVLTVSSGQGLLKTSTKSGNWNDPSVWTPAGVPALNDNVKILATHTVTLTGNTTIDGNNISAYNPGAAGDRLNVLGTLNTAGFNLTVNGGISAGTTSSPAGTINTGTGGVVTQNWSGTQQTSILITGSGGFTKLGSGATNFNRDQTYTGVTTIGAGATLGIGFNTTTGSISSSSIVNNGTLNLNRSNNFTLSANISGSGNVNKLRSSTVTLSGNNTYTGTTSIGTSFSTVGGTLVIANSSSLPAATNLIFYSATSGKLQLNANATCASLLYGSTAQAAGTYGSTSSSASNKNNTYFAGTGVLTVSSSTPSPSRVSLLGLAQYGPAADNTASAEVSLYPNPTVTGRVSFRVPMAGLRSNGGALSSTVEAIDYTGSVKLSRNVTIDAAGRGELDASPLNRGAYILRVTVAGRVFTTRMVRQ